MKFSEKQGDSFSERNMDHRIEKKHGVGSCNAVDGQNPACYTRHDDYPIVNGVLTIPGGAGILPSTV